MYLFLYVCLKSLIDLLVGDRYLTCRSMWIIYLWLYLIGNHCQNISEVIQEFHHYHWKGWYTCSKINKTQSLKYDCVPNQIVQM